MAKGVALFIIWMAGIDLGLCIGEVAADGPSMPQIWLGAFILNFIAVIAVGVVTIGIRPPNAP